MKMYANNRVVLDKFHELVLAPDGYHPAFGAHVAVKFYHFDAEQIIRSTTTPTIQINASFGGDMDVTEAEQWAEVINTAVLVAKGWPGPPWLPANVVEAWRSALLAIREGGQ